MKKTIVSILTAVTLLGSASIPVFAETPETAPATRNYRFNTTETRLQDGSGQQVGKKQGGQGVKAGINNSEVRQGNAGNGPKDTTGVKRGNDGLGFNRGTCAN